MHGKTSRIVHDGKSIFSDVPQKFIATRYHSLVAEKESLPDELVVSATDESAKTIMAVRHKSAPLEGVQFHPESILTEEGKKILKNFLAIYG